MKKVAALLFVATLIVLLTACSGNNPADTGIVTGAKDELFELKLYLIKVRIPMMRSFTAMRRLSISVETTV